MLAILADSRNSNPIYSEPNLANQFVYYNMMLRIPGEREEDRNIKERITKKYLNRISNAYTYETQ